MIYLKHFCDIARKIASKYCPAKTYSFESILAHSHGWNISGFCCEMFARLKKGLVLCEFVNRLWSMIHGLKRSLMDVFAFPSPPWTFDLEISAVHISKPNVSPWWQIKVYRQTNPKIRHHGITNLSVTLPQAAPKALQARTIAFMVLVKDLKITCCAP